jgi:hypothetical protein
MYDKLWSMRTGGPIEPDGIYVRDWRKKPLGKLRKRFCLLIILLGACTFLLPMIILDSPILNRTEWSPWNIASKLIAGELPVAGDDVLISMAVTYVLMPFALVAIYRPGPPKALAIIEQISLAMDGVLWQGSRSVEKSDSLRGWIHLHSDIRAWVAL